MPESDDGRITLAVVKNEISHLRNDVERMHRDLCSKIQNVDQRMMDEIKDHEDRLRSLEGSQPWNIWRDAGAFLAAIAAGIAGLVKN